MDDANTNLLEFTQEKNDEVIEELEEQGKLPKDVLEGGERYENEQPRQGL